MYDIFIFYSDIFTFRLVCNMRNPHAQYSEAIGNCMFSFHFYGMLTEYFECVTFALFENSEQSECIQDMPCLFVFLSVWVDVIIPELLVVFYLFIFFKLRTEVFTFQNVTEAFLIELQLVLLKW
jgi:hypothetical protein